MNSYRDLLIQRFHREQGSWPRFRAAPLRDLRTTLLRWRSVFAPSSERSEVLDRLRRDLPDNLSDIARDAVPVVAARPTVAARVGLSGPELADLIERRDECEVTAALAGQIERAAELALREAAQVLFDQNQQVLDAIAVVQADESLSADERAALTQCLAKLNGLAELAQHRAARKAQRRERQQSGTSERLSAEQQAEQVRLTAAALLGQKPSVH